MSKKKYNQFICSRMILPEHRNNLKLRFHRVLQEEDPLSSYCPDEQQKEEFDQLLREALQEGLEINIIISNKEGGLNKISGVIPKKCEGLKKIKVAAADGNRSINVSEIIKIEKTRT